jgi:hypothetical protein
MTRRSFRGDKNDDDSGFFLILEGERGRRFGFLFFCFVLFSVLGFELRRFRNSLFVDYSKEANVLKKRAQETKIMLCSVQQAMLCGLRHAQLEGPLLPADNKLVTRYFEAVI